MHHPNHHERSARSLSSRGGLIRTFGSLAAFAAFALLGLGGYLIGEQIRNPVQAQAVTTIFAALVISCGLVLLYGLFYEIARRQFPTARRSRPAAEPDHRIIVIPRSHTLEWNSESKDLSFHGRYIDQARIRP
jgi:hypothetical protein